MNKYVFSGCVSDEYGHIVWRECSMTTYAQSLRKAATNIKYNIRKRLGYELYIPVKITGEIRSGEEICQVDR